MDTYVDDFKPDRGTNPASGKPSAVREVVNPLTGLGQESQYRKNKNPGTYDGYGAVVIFSSAVDRRSCEIQ
jgi:hypothetical protein